MKTFTHLWLDDKGLKAFNAPDKLMTVTYGKSGYDEAFQQALAEGVYFKPEQVDEVIHSLFEDEQLTCGDEMEKHKPYPVPDGYEVRVELNDPIPMNYDGVDSRGDYKYYCPKCGRGGSYMGTGQVHCLREECREYAILVPKEKDKKQIMAEKFWSNIEKSYPKQVEPKQQSIEEAAEAHAKKEWPFWSGSNGYNECRDSFIAGAKSQAAKEYWYEQLKDSQLKNEISFLLGENYGTVGRSENYYIAGKLLKFIEQFKREQQ